MNFIDRLKGFTADLHQAVLAKSSKALSPCFQNIHKIKFYSCEKGIIYLEKNDKTFYFKLKNISMKWLKSRNYKRHYGHYISKITDFILHTPCICQTKIDLREVYKVHFESLKEGQVKFETFLRDFQQNSSEAFLEQGLYDVFSLNNYTIVLTTTVHEKDHLEISPVEKLNQVNQLIQKVYQQTCHQLQLTLSSD